MYCDTMDSMDWWTIHAINYYVHCLVDQIIIRYISLEQTDAKIRDSDQTYNFPYKSSVSMRS